LYIVKKIIEGHDGKVWVESDGEGKGSTFYIELIKVSDAERAKRNKKKK
jgi:signal transduction histidine kinase